MELISLNNPQKTRREEGVSSQTPFKRHLTTAISRHPPSTGVATPRRAAIKPEAAAMSRAPEPAAAPGRPSALAAPFVPSAARRALRRPHGPVLQQQSHNQLPHHHHHRTSSSNRSSQSSSGGSADAYASGGLREHARLEAALLQRSSPPGSGYPDSVHRYYALLLLELPVARAICPHMGNGLIAYKALCATDGAPCVLLRVPGPPPAASAQVVRAAEAWRRVRHAGLAELREVFSTRAFAASDVNEVIFAYAFPGRAESLLNLFLSNSNAPRVPLPEDALWALASQLLSVVSACHARALAVRGALDPSAILVVGRNRVKLLGVGLNDAFDPTGADHVPHHGASAQNFERTLLQADLGALAALLLALALRSNPNVVRGGALVIGIAGALDTLRATPGYSPDYVRLVETLVVGSSRGSRISIRDALSVAAPRMAAELGNVWTHADGLHRQLNAEFDASRMFRLLVLLGFVNERGDAGVEPQWSETGDRYLLKLFRDYVFHRASDIGTPVLDIGHVVECLSRLDIGSSDQVLLTSRDNNSLLVASYDDLRRCLLHAVDELCAPRRAPLR